MLKQLWNLRVACLWLSLLAGGLGLGAAELTDSPYTVESWSNEEGLPQSSVISVIQTRDGYLWLGTLRGLVRFDGNRFTIFNEFNTPGLNSDQIVFLFEDSHTNLWVGTDTAGVVLIKDGRAQTINIGPIGHESRLTSACEDTNGAVWLYTADARLTRWQNGRAETLSLFQPPPPAFSRLVTAEKAGPIWISEYEAPFPGMNTVVGMFSFRSENFHPAALAIEQNFQARRIDYILASRNGGLWRLLDGRVQKWSGQVQDFGPYPWGDDTVKTACEDASGNLIVGTFRSGVYWFDADGNYRHITREQGLSSDYVLSLCLDREGDLWVGTDGDGLNRVKKKVFLSPVNLSPWSVQSVARDGNGGLWTAFNANGLAYWRTNAAQHFGVGHGQNAWTVLVDHQQQVWVGALNEGLFQLQNGEFQPAAGAELLGRQIFALFEDRSGQVWAGTGNGLAVWNGQAWKIYTTRDGLPENTVRAIAQDPAGVYWIGTENQGVTRLQGGRFTLLPASPNGPPGNDISTLYIDRAGTLWVGTAGHGLACLNNGRWSHFSTDNGLDGNSISYLIEDDAGNLWIGSNKGLMRIPETSDGLNLADIRTFGRADGLPSRECTIGSQPAACRADDGSLWFPTTKGLVSVNPSDLTTNHLLPLVMIESVRVDNHEQKTNLLSSAWSQTILLPPGSEQLEIHYTGLHFSAPREMRFRYQLEGHESTPTEETGP